MYTRFSPLAICILSGSLVGLGQSSSFPSFINQVSFANPALQPGHAITLVGSIQRTAGSLRESGNVSMTVQSDGSATVNFSLPSGKRNETYGPLSSRVCTGTNERSQPYKVELGQCLRPFPWFAPQTVGPQTVLGNQPITIVDAGLVARGDKQFHEADYTINFPQSPSNIQVTLSKLTLTKVLYDPNTLLPAMIEYNSHPGGSIDVNLPTRIEYSSYSLVSGIPIPYQIDKYVNNSLVFSISIGTATSK